VANVVSIGLQGSPGPLAASVADLTALAALSTATYVYGTVVVVQAAPAAYWAWQSPSTAVPDGVKIVAGQGNGNWIRVLLLVAV
jgi:hypothetical protein